MANKIVPTSQEAAAEIAVLNRNGLPAYCPMSKGTCRHDCVCLTKSTYTIVPDGYMIHPRYCDNRGLHGDG